MIKVGLVLFTFRAAKFGSMYIIGPEGRKDNVGNYIWDCMFINHLTEYREPDF